MKHRVSTVLIVLSMLLALVTVAAAPKAAGTVTLVGAGYVEGKGVVFTFHITGKVSKSDMKGSVTFEGGGNYGLDCVKVDSETVKCTAPKAVAGHDVTVTWGGSTFWTHVAGISAPQKSQYCYDIYDWTLDLPSSWVVAGTHCQDSPAEYGDWILWYNPIWELEDYYDFLPESPESWPEEGQCYDYHTGDAYYLWYCDEPNLYEE